MAHFFLSPELDARDCMAGAEVSLTGSEARHAVTVSRVRVGESLAVGNGSGLIVVGMVLAARPDRVQLRVLNTRFTPEPTIKIRLAQALAKGDRDELAVQAATELGVDGVIPWSANRSVSRWQGQKVAKGRERWQRIVREATKQSIRPRIPEVAELASSIQLAAFSRGNRLLVLDPGAQEALSTIELDDRDLVLVVGPEGGVTPGELELFGRAGAHSVRLGTGVLRTSTAGPAGIAVLNTRLGRW